MRSYTKFILLSPIVVVFTGGLLLMSGCLSTPRDFASPPTTIRIVDQNDKPISGVQVSRHWYDSDCDTKGSETNMTDLTGTAMFPKIPANVGLFTGAGRKVHDNLAPRGSASGTSTSLRAHFVGVYDVVPRNSPLHKIEHAHDLYEDKDGVVFYTSFDSRSNTMTEITFPEKSKLIDYVVSAKSQGQ